MHAGPVLAVADLLLGTLLPGVVGAAAATTPPPPFTIDALSAAPGSGAALEDWIAVVVAGGDASGQQGVRHEEEAADAGADGEGDGGAGEFGEGGVSPFLGGGDSQCDVYARHAESFLGRVLGTFSRDMVPRVLLRFQAAAAVFAAACQQVAGAAAAAAGGGGGAADATAAVVAAAHRELHSFRGLDLCLRLLMRCGPHLPARGVTEAPEPLASAAATVSGAHAVETLGTLSHLAAGWLQTVQAVAAASATAAQPGGQPCTPAHAAAAGNGGSGLEAMLLAGGRVHKAIGSLAATWLSQQVAAQASGSGDPEAVPTVCQLALAVPSSAASLLQAVAGDPRLAGWQAALHPAAVWGGESLVSLSSVALSSSFKPPAALLEAVWQCEAVQVGGSMGWAGFAGGWGEHVLERSRGSLRFCTPAETPPRPCVWRPPCPCPPPT